MPFRAHMEPIDPLKQEPQTQQADPVAGQLPRLVPISPAVLRVLLVVDSKFARSGGSK